MTSVSSCRNELAEFVSNHILCNINRYMLSSIMYCECQTYE